MGILIYGHAKTINGIDEAFVYCPSCEKSSWADIMVEGIYFHIYWVPIFPFDKTLNMICKECGLKRFGLPFNPTFLPNYYEIRNKYRHPFKTYFLLIILSLMVLMAIFI